MTDRKKQIFKLRGRGFQQAEIGSRLGVTQGYVSKVLRQNKRKILAKEAAHEQK